VGEATQSRRLIRTQAGGLAICDQASSQPPAFDPTAAATDDVEAAGGRRRGAWHGGASGTLPGGAGKSGLGHRDVQGAVLDAAPQSGLRRRRTQRVVDSDSDDDFVQPHATPWGTRCSRGGAVRGRGRGGPVSAKNPPDGQAKYLLGRSAGGQGRGRGAVLQPLLRQQPSGDGVALVAAEGPCEGAAPAPASAPLTLVLFDEADTLLEQDRGFAGTLAALIPDSKRPILLTLGSSSPTAVSSAPGVKLVSLSRPTHEQLLRLLVLVCAAEEASASVRQLSAIADAQVGGAGPCCCVVAVHCWDGGVTWWFKLQQWRHGFLKHCQPFELHDLEIRV